MANNIDFYLHNKTTKRLMRISNSEEKEVLTDIVDIHINGEYKAVRLSDGYMEYIDEFTPDTNKINKVIKFNNRSENYRCIIDTNDIIYYGNIVGVVSSDTIKSNIVWSDCYDDIIYIMTDDSKMLTVQSVIYYHTLPVDTSLAKKFVITQDWIYIITPNNIVRLDKSYNYNSTINIPNVLDISVSSDAENIYAIDSTKLYQIKIIDNSYTSLSMGLNNMAVVSLPDLSVKVLDDGNKLHTIFYMQYLEEQILSESFDSIVNNKQDTSRYEFMDGNDIIYVEGELYCYNFNQKKYILLTEWEQDKFYYTGDKVTYKGNIYECIASHNSYSADFSVTADSWKYISDINISYRSYNVMASQDIHDLLRSYETRSGTAKLPAYVNKLIDDYSRSETIIPHNLGREFIALSAFPTSDTEGRLSDFWIRSDANNVYIGALGDYPGDIAWYGLAAPVTA